MLEVVVESACTLLNSISSQFGANTNANSASDFTELHVLELLWSIGSWVRSQQRHVLKMFEVVVESTCSLLNSIRTQFGGNTNANSASDFTELQVLELLLIEVVVKSACSLLNSIHSEWRYNCNCQRDSDFTELQVLKVGHD